MGTRRSVLLVAAGLAAACVLALASLASPARASSSCYVGGSGITYNVYGIGAKFKSLQARQGMNCSSARYVFNSWLRPVRAGEALRSRHASSTGT